MTLNFPSNHDSPYFRDQFSKEQKAAIIGSFVVISRATGSMSQKEIEFIDKASTILSLDLTDSIFDKALTSGADGMIMILKSLKPAFKEWYIAALHKLLKVNGFTEEMKLRYAFGISEDIGINEDK